MPAPENRPRKPERSSVSSGSMNTSGGKNQLDDIARATKQTAEALARIAAASGASSVYGLSGFEGRRPSSGIAPDPYLSQVASGSIYGFAKTVRGSSGVDSPASYSTPRTPPSTYRLAPLTDVRPQKPTNNLWKQALASEVAWQPGTLPPGMSAAAPYAASPFAGLVGGGLGRGGAGAGLADIAGFIRGGLGSAALLHGLNQTTQFANTVQDPFATGETKARSLFRQFAPGGDTLLNFKDALSGRQAGMDLARYQGDLSRVDVRSRLEQSAMQLHYAPQQAGYLATAQAYAGQSAITGGVFDRATASGKTAYEDAQRLLPLRKETARLERESASASAQRLASERELERVSKTENNLIRERQAVQRQLNAGGSGVEYQRLLERDKSLAAEIEGVNQQARQAKLQVVEASRNEIATRSEAQKARVREDLLGRAENLEARAQRSEASAGRLGDMNPFQRQMGLQGIKLLEAGENPDLIPQNLRNAARAFDPESYDRAIKQHGITTAEFQERQAAGKRGFEGDYGKLYQEADALRQQAGEQEFRIDQTAAQNIVKAGGNLGTFIATEIQKFADSVKTSILTKLRENRNATN